MSKENSKEKVIDPKANSHEFENINEELEFYRKKCVIIETDLFKAQIQNKKLDSQIRKLQEIVTSNSNNVNNTSISFFLPSEFKTQWEIMNKDYLFEAFENMWETYFWLAHLIQDTFKIVYELTFISIKDMILFILKYLNFPLNDSLYDTFLPKFRNILQENFTTIFIFKPEKFISVKNKLKHKVMTEYEKFSLTDQLNLDLESKAFYSLVQSIYKLCIYMILHDPLLKINIKDYKSRELEYFFYSKNDHLGIEGFMKNDSPCIIILPPPLLKNNFPYQGIKPAAYIIKNADDKILSKCKGNLKIVEQTIEKKDEFDNESDLKSNIFKEMNKTCLHDIVPEANNDLDIAPVVSNSVEVTSFKNVIETRSNHKDVNNFPKRIKEVSISKPIACNNRIFQYKEKSTSSLDIIIDGDYIEGKILINLGSEIAREKSCFDHPFSKQKGYIKKVEKQINKEENTKSFRSNSMKSVKNKSHNSSERDINKSQNKDINLKSNLLINTKRTNNKEIPYKEENEFYNVYQTTSNENGNEDKMHDILMNISSTFAFIRQKNPPSDNMIERQLSSKSPKDCEKMKYHEKKKFSNTGSFSNNFLYSNQVQDKYSLLQKRINKNKVTNTNKVLIPEEGKKDFPKKKEKTKLEKDIHANLKRMYSQSNKIKIDNLNPSKFKTLTDKYFNNSPKVIKLGNKMKQELANRESIKQFYNEYLSKGFLKTNVDNMVVANDSNQIDASNNMNEKSCLFISPKSSTKNLNYYSTNYNLQADKGLLSNETKNVSSFEPSKTKTNTFLKLGSDCKQLNINVNHNENLPLKCELKKKIDYSNLKVSKNFRSKISQISNVNICTTTNIIGEQKLNVEKQSSLKPKVKLTINNND